MGRPDYGYLKGLMKDLFFRENYTYDLVFDWTVLNDAATVVESDGGFKGAHSKKRTQEKPLPWKFRVQPDVVAARKPTNLVQVTNAELVHGDDAPCTCTVM